MRNAILGALVVLAIFAVLAFITFVKIFGGIHT